VTERRTQAERRAESRLRLIEAAIKLLGSHGYAGTSLVEIGKAAGLSRGLVSHHFGSKEACMQAVVATIRERAAAQLNAVDARGLAALDRLFEVYFGGVRRHDANARAMYVILVEGLTSTPGLRSAVAKTNAITRGHIAEMVRDARAEHDDVGGDSEVEATAVLIEGILRGVALQYLADPDVVDLDRTVQLAKVMVRALLLAGQPAG
jgi:AcrR family transcriptional regulator